MPVNKLRSYLKSTILFIAMILAIVFIRLFVVDIFRIPSPSMSPTLEPGDIIVVSKMSYGPRVVNFRKLFKEKRLEYKWHKGFGKPQKGDVFVFNWPDYHSLYEGNPDFYGDFIVKRCFAASNDTVLILNEGMKNEKMKEIVRNERNEENEENEEMKEIREMGYEYVEKPLLFPYDSTLNWTIDRYGPLWVPGKGKTMKLNAINASHYKGMLLYEGNSINIRNDSVLLNGKYAYEYTFKENYYFMRGDNFFGSADSRYWGFVPKKSIVGKAVLVLLSLDPDAKWYRKFRWGRFLKRIK